MEPNLLTLCATKEQELAIKQLFQNQGWQFEKKAKDSSKGQKKVLINGSEDQVESFADHEDSEEADNDNADTADHDGSDTDTAVKVIPCSVNKNLVGGKKTGKPNHEIKEAEGSVDSAAHTDLDEKDLKDNASKKTSHHDTEEGKGFKMLKVRLRPVANTFNKGSKISVWEKSNNEKGNEKGERMFKVRLPAKKVTKESNVIVKREKKPRNRKGKAKECAMEKKGAKSDGIKKEDPNPHNQKGKAKKNAMEKKGVKSECMEKEDPTPTTLPRASCSIVKAGNYLIVSKLPGDSPIKGNTSIRNPPVIKSDSIWDRIQTQVLSGTKKLDPHQSRKRKFDEISDAINATPAVITEPLVKQELHNLAALKVETGDDIDNFKGDAETSEQTQTVVNESLTKSTTIQPGAPGVATKRRIIVVRKSPVVKQPPDTAAYFVNTDGKVVVKSEKPQKVAGVRKAYQNPRRTLETLPDILHITELSEADKAKCMVPDKEAEHPLVFDQVTKFVPTLEMYYCEECKYLFPALRVFDCHTRRGICVFKCKHCSEVFTFRNYTAYLKHNEEHRALKKILHQQRQEETEKRKASGVPEHVIDRLCQMCGLTFHSRSSWSEHNRRYHDNGKKAPHQCCNTKFFGKSHYQRHRCRVHGDPCPYLCATCGAGFPIAGDLKRHVQNVHVTEKYKCNLCNLHMNYKSQYDDHMGMHKAEQRHHCVCGRKFTHRSSLSKHRGVCRIHKKSGEEARQLSVSTMDGATFQKESSKTKVSNEQACKRKVRYSCECGQKFFGKSGLSTHRTRCSGVVNIVEEKGGDLEDHTALHKKEGFDHRCMCGQWYDSTYWLEKHQGFCRMLNNKDKKSFSNCMCGRSFSSSTGLRVHQSSCKIFKYKEDDNLCPCGKGYSSRQLLEKHQKRCNVYKKSVKEELYEDLEEEEVEEEAEIEAEEEYMVATAPQTTYFQFTPQP